MIGRILHQRRARDGAGVGVVERAPGADDPLGQADEDGVEHDRGDHLVGTPIGLEKAGEGGGHEPEQPADDDGQRHVDDPRQRESVAEPRREHGAGQQLALGADVEETRLHADDHGEPGEDQWGCSLERASDGFGTAQAALDQRPIRHPWTGAVERDQHGADGQGDHDRRQRQQHALGPRAQPHDPPLISRCLEPSPTDAPHVADWGRTVQRGCGRRSDDTPVGTSDSVVGVQVRACSPSAPRRRAPAR